MRFYTTEKIGPKQALTPEGFLICADVPIARTGRMYYGPGETPLDVGPNGVVTVIRDADEVFRPEFILSFNGKPVINEHPPGGAEINPNNWKSFAAGTVMSPRRGEGEQSDLLLADIVICEAEAIAAVRSGKREVSCGYDADYEEIAPGEGRQVAMIGNHVALVESGRCGPRCAIADGKTLTGDSAMATKQKPKWWDSFKRSILEAVKTKDEAKVEEALEGAADQIETMPAGDEEGTHLHIHQGGESGARSMSDDDIENRFGALEQGHQEIKDSLEELRGMVAGKGGEKADDAEDPELEEELEEEAPTGVGDKARKATDSAYLEDSFQETLSLAEILMPGIRIPAFDRSAPPKKTFDAVCNLRRQALDLAYHQPDTRAIIDELNHGKPLELTRMKCGDVRTLFRAAAGMKKAGNNQQRHSAEDRHTAGGGLGVTGKIKTPADLNKRHAELYRAH